MASTSENSNDLNRVREARDEDNQEENNSNNQDQPNLNQNGGEDAEEHIEVLLEFQDVTGMEDMDESRRILRQHNWDLLGAISAHMGFESVPQQVQHRELNSNIGNIGPTYRPHAHSSSQSPSSSSSSSSGASYALVRDDTRNRVRDTGRGGLFRWIWRLVSAPFDFFFQYFWDFLGYGLRFLRQDPRLAITDPVQDVVTFIAAYEAKYGREHPIFYQGSYSQALNDAKRELKFLLVYLHSEEHMDTPTFCRNVMPHQGFCDVIRENMLFWACSVSLPEGYRASQALRENTYPFLALIVLKNNRMTIVSRIEGELNPETLLERIHQSVADNEAFLIAERQERLERSMTQTLRQQQDAAYLESLEIDKEKERKKREEKERLRQIELERQQKEQEEIDRREMLKRQKIEAGQNLKPEPSPDQTGVVRVVIKLPTGARLERRFLSSDSLMHLYNFVFSRPDAPDYFQIATNFPKRTLNCQPSEEQPVPPTFAESGLGKSEMLFVYDLES